MADSFAKQVYDFVSNIPPGKVMTYGDIASALGRSQSARLVGAILKRNPAPFYKARSSTVRAKKHDPIPVPCHRVIRADLKLGQYSGGDAMKQKLLKQEGVKVSGGRVAIQHLQRL